MAAPNGMAPRPTNANANAMAQMETFLRQLPVELQTQMLNLPLDQKINFARQYMAAKKAQSNGIQMLQQPQQQQQQPPQRPLMDAQAFAQAQAQALIGQQQQQQQRMQGPPLRPDSIPGYTAEQLKQLSANNPGIQHLLSQIAVNGQQVTPASQAALQQLIQAQAMQNQNHIQPQLQQGLNHPGIPMPRTPSQTQLGMARGMSNQGPMQHPSSPASFSSPQIQQSPKQGGISTPQQHNIPLGQPNNLAHFNKVAELQNRANGGPPLTPQQMQHVLQSQAMRAQGSNQGQVRPIRPPMQQQPQHGVNGQMLQNGQGQGMSVRPQVQSPANAAMMLNGVQGFAGTPSGLAVDRIVDHLQELGDLRDQNALDKTQKEAINTLISNPRVVQDQFVARAAKAQEDRLSVAQQELRNGGVPGMMMMDGQGNQSQAAAIRALQQNKIGQAALAMQQQQLQNQFARQQAAQIGGSTPQSSMNGPGGMMSTGQSSNPMTPGDGQAQSRGSNSGPNTPGGGMMSDISQQTGQQFVAKISSFSEEKREEIFRKNPQIRPWYTKQLAQLMQRHHERQLQEVAGHQIAQAQAQDRMLNIGNMQGQMNGIGGAQQNVPTQMPLPNLQLPANRQRNSSAGSNQQQQQQSPQQMALSQAAAIAQQQQQLQAVVAQAQSQIQQQQAMPHSQSQSPGGGQGTPISRANGALSVPRGGTPNRVMSLQGVNNRASPGPNQGGSPSLRQADIKPGMGGFNGQAPNVADLQARMQGNIPHSYVNGVMQGDSQKNQGQMPSQQHTPNIPHDFRPITVQSLVIPEKLSDQETRWPVASNFPNKLGARPTLSNGLGPGAVLGMPIIESRPSTFKDLIDKLTSKQPSVQSRPLRGSLFDRSGHAEEEELEEEPKIIPVEKVTPSTEPDMDHEPEGSAVSVPKKRKISEIARNVDKDIVLSDGVEKFLLEIADELIESVAQAGCRLAKHRKGHRLDVKDLQVHLERDSNIFIPGYAYEAIRVDQAPFLRKTQVPSTRTMRMAALQQAKRDGAPIGKAPVKQAQQA